MNDEHEENASPEQNQSEEDLVWEEEGETGADKIKKLREKLKTCEKERDEYLSGWQRVKADYINARKEEEKNRGEFVKLASKEILLDMIAVLDSFDQAQANKEAWEKVDKNWRIGIEYIYTQFLSALERHGMKQTNPLGQTFDPNVHVSVGTSPAENQAGDHTIVRVIQKGYLLHDIPIRLPKVEVAVWQNTQVAESV